MREDLHDFCERNEVHVADEPPLPFSSAHTWLVRDTSGHLWVLKYRAPEDNVSEVLKKFALLHPPFHYPQITSPGNEPCLLYPYIEGELLADSVSEERGVVGQIMEVISRISAMMRSLVLVPYYQETLHLHQPDTHAESKPGGGFTLKWAQGVDDQHKQARRREIAASYQWTETSIPRFCDVLHSQGVWSGAAPLDEFRQHLSRILSMHIPTTGSNLAHTAMHPEHLLFCPDRKIAVLGWNIASRPRFHMIYTYLCWSFLRSPRSDAREVYRGYLTRNSEAAFSADHQRAFAVCLLEQAARCFAPSRTHHFKASPRRLQEAEELFSECCENLAVT
ncbi:MAG: hypothetical protein ACLFVT_06115 [Syntrophobacteria bacterium]